MQVLKSNVKRAGLTLIELIIVLFILAALAGVALALLPNFQKLTHGSTSANSIRGAQTAIAVNLARQGVLGNNFDALITAGGDVPDYVATSDGLVPVTTDADMVDALNDLGITTLVPATHSTLAAFEADATVENVTFEGHDYDAAPIAVTGTPELAELTAAARLATEFNFNLEAGQFANIFAFGIGERCSLVGTNGTFQEAPVHTPGEGSPITTYARLVVLVGYNPPPAPGEEPEAVYLGVVGIDDGENFNNINRHLGEYLEASE